MGNRKFPGRDPAQEVQGLSSMMTDPQKHLEVLPCNQHTWAGPLWAPRFPFYQLPHRHRLQPGWALGKLSQASPLPEAAIDRRPQALSSLRTRTCWVPEGLSGVEVTLVAKWPLD